ncbi:hypothetical protein [Methylocella sp.]|uniref:cell division protein FtsL n=1 Tax=Methylocella sp. TaxID=1978226 RepID=UPI0037847D31
MVRILNVLAVLALLGSAIYAYSIKYETIFHAERIVKLKHEIKAEQDRIATMRAEYSYLTRPERVQALTEKFLDLQPLSLRQIVSLDALPRRPERVAPVVDAAGAESAPNPAPNPAR